MDSDVPDVVKAYKKVKSTDSFKDLSISIPSTPSEPVTVDAVPPQVPETKVVPSVSEASPDSDISLSFKLDVKVPDMPDVKLPEMPDVKLPDMPDVKLPDMPDVQVEAMKAEASAKMSAMNDVLKAAKEEYGAKSASLIESYKASIPPPPTSSDVSEFIKNSGIGIQKSVATEFSPLPEGKAPTLGEYFARLVAGQAGGVTGLDTEVGNMAEAKEKATLLVGNIYDLLGLENAPDSSALFSGNIPIEIPQQLPDLGLPGLDEIPPGAAGWTIAAFALFVAVGQRRAGISAARDQMEQLVQKEASAVSELTEQVKIMEKDINKLNTKTIDLRGELSSATNKLTKKELEISKAKLKVADKELASNRKVQQLEERLREGGSQIKMLEVELEETKQVQNELVDALERVKDMEGELKVVEPKTVIEQIIEKPKAKTKGATKKKKTTKGAKTVKAKAKGTKVAAKKKKTTKGEKVVKAKVAKVKVAKAKKAVKKSVKVAVKAAKKPAKVAVSTTKDWSDLSQSTLARKTVKELKEYLEEKGISTTGEDGKPLKKALLVEAVLAL